MGRRKKVDPALASIAEKLRLRGFDTLGRIVDLLQFDLPLSEEEATHPYVQALAQQDFSLMPNIGNPDKPWRLMLRAKVALENLGRLLQFQSPVLRSASVSSEHRESWVITVHSFGSSAEKLALPRKSIDVPEEVQERRPTRLKLGAPEHTLPSDEQLDPAKLQPRDATESVAWPELPPEPL